MRAAFASLAIICVGLLSGCAKLKEGFQSFGGSSPRHLDSSPDTVGLLIVHAPMRHKGSLSFGIGSSISLDGAVLVRADTNVTIQENSVKDLVLFQLRPATYHVVAVRGSFRSGNFWHHLVAPVDSLVGPVAVAAGQIIYVGRLTVTGHSAVGRSGFAYTYEWDRDPAREAEALTIVAERHKKSPWIPALQRRLTALPPRVP